LTNYQLLGKLVASREESQAVIDKDVKTLEAFFYFFMYTAKRLEDKD